MAIVLQSAWTVVIALTGRYDQILNYQVPIDATFFGLSAACLFVLRRRDKVAAAHGLNVAEPGFRVPGHPVTTVVFILACWAIVANALWKYPRNSLVGVAILLLGLPVYFWRMRRRKQEV
jgi:APA family basic amino acid/polyamine antiporter